MPLDLVVLSFAHPEGAERAFADVRERAPEAPWLHELAFVERRHKGRMIVRGTFSGHYLDVEETGDAMGKDTAVGALTGAAVGAMFGWFGAAAGLVAGGTVGGLIQANHFKERHGALFDELRGDVPERSSAVILLAEPAQVDAMLAAFEGAGGSAKRRTLSTQEVAALRDAVERAPAAAAPLEEASGADLP
jgi:uncharacterized membrane protein